MQLMHSIISSGSLHVSWSPQSGLCLSCCRAKLYQLSYAHFSSQFSAPFHLLFADVWGSTPVLSRGGFRFYLYLDDDYNKFMWLFLMKCKYDVVFVFYSFKRQVETLFNSKIRV